MKGGHVQYVLIRALTNGTCRLHDSFEGHPVVVRRRDCAKPVLSLPAACTEAEISFPVEADTLYLIELADRPSGGQWSG